jgi:hypothetical protein
MKQIGNPNVLFCRAKTCSTAARTADLPRHQGAGTGGVLTWVNRITRERTHERDLFGHWVARWRVIRTSNAYLFRYPKVAETGQKAGKDHQARAKLESSVYNQGHIERCHDCGSAAPLRTPGSSAFAGLAPSMAVTRQGRWSCAACCAS